MQQDWFAKCKKRFATIRGQVYDRRFSTPRRKTPIVDLTPNPTTIAAMPLPPGTPLGPYEIRELLGKGGMGEVYRARDRRLDRDVALKVISDAIAHDSSARARFEREAKAIAALTHP